MCLRCLRARPPLNAKITDTNPAFSGMHSVAKYSCDTEQIDVAPKSVFLVGMVYAYGNEFIQTNHHLRSWRRVGS
jgi:hypothetical protein